MMCLGKGATGFTSLSGSEMSAFLTSLRRYPVKKQIANFVRHTTFVSLCFVSALPNTMNILLKYNAFEAQSNRDVLSSPNLIIKGFVNQGQHFIQLNLQPADISHDWRVIGSQLNSVKPSSVASCTPASLLPSHNSFIETFLGQNPLISCRKLQLNEQTLPYWKTVKINVSLPRILSISSHFFISLTCFRWNVVTLGLS